MPKKVAALLFVCSCFLPLQALAPAMTSPSWVRPGVAAAAKAYKFFFEQGRREDYLSSYHASVRWLHAEIDLATKKEERTAAYATHLKRVKDWRKKLLGVDLPIDKDGPASVLSVLDALQLEAEYWLAKERAGK